MKSVEFTAHGPFDVPVESGATGRRFLLDEVWRNDPQLEALARRCGCYVFAVRGVKGIITPHYVGLTRKRFDREVFNRTNLPKYLSALSDHRRGRPVLFIIAHPHQAKINGTYIGEVENFLIQAGWARNPALQNKKGIHRPKWLIRGVIRSIGKPSQAARQLRSVMGIRK